MIEAILNHPFVPLALTLVLWGAYVARELNRLQRAVDIKRDETRLGQLGFRRTK